MILKKQIIKTILVIRDFDFNRCATISECNMNSFDFFEPISRLTIRISTTQRKTQITHGHNNETTTETTFIKF